MYLYLNGQIVPKEEAAISPFDHGYLYGLGVFETFRTYNGHPFLITDHLTRLRKGMRELNIPRPINETHLRKVIQDLLIKNNLSDAYCRLNVSAGVGEIGLRTASYDEETIILFQKELPPSIPLREKEGIVLELRRNTPETKERLKSHHYLNNIAAKREIGSSMDQEGIFLTDKGFICEGITSNIFWIKEGELFTPSVDTGLLNGITRQFILFLAEELQLPVHTGSYMIRELENAQEVFFTNSVQEIMPLNKLGSIQFPGSKGEFVQLLYKHYQKYVTHLCSIQDAKEEGCL